MARLEDEVRGLKDLLNRQIKKIISLEKQIKDMEAVSASQLKSISDAYAKEIEALKEELDKAKKRSSRTTKSRTVSEDESVSE